MRLHLESKVTTWSMGQCPNDHETAPCSVHHTQSAAANTFSIDWITTLMNFITVSGHMDDYRSIQFSRQNS